MRRVSDPFISVNFATTGFAVAARVWIQIIEFIARQTFIVELWLFIEPLMKPTAKAKRHRIEKQRYQQ